MNPAQAYARLERATEGLRAPFALVDLDAMWANAAEMEGRAQGKPIRLASKSVRCRELQSRVLARPGFRGTLAFTLPEALWLAEQGTEDILVAYPTADELALRELAERGADVIVMVDSAEQLDLIDRARTGARVRVCLDIDTGWIAAGGRMRAGARRSPLRTPAQAVVLAREALARPGLELVAIMAYEAQIAGVGDDPPDGRCAPARSVRCRRARARSSRGAELRSWRRCRPSSSARARRRSSS